MQLKDCSCVKCTIDFDIWYKLMIGNAELINDWANSLDNSVTPFFFLNNAFPWLSKKKIS
jgi:hypothetical protein